MTRIHSANATDTASSVIASTTTQTLNISDATFKTVVGLNDKNVQAVLDVIQTKSDDRFTSTHIYNDKDGDGQYTESLDVQVAVNSTGLRQQTFTFNDDGTITETLPVSLPHVVQSTPTPILNKVTLDNVTYVTKTMSDVDGSGYHFEIFSDSNADGTWTQIAQGETLNGVNTTTSAIDLVGIQSYLADASAIVS